MRTPHRDTLIAGQDAAGQKVGVFDGTAREFDPEDDPIDHSPYYAPRTDRRHNGVPMGTVGHRRRYA